MSVSINNNNESGLMKAYEKNAKQDFFRYRADASAPAHDFKLVRTYPEVRVQGQVAQKIRIPIARDGLLGKVLLKWTFSNPGGSEVFNDRIGLNMGSEYRIVGQTGVIERVTPEILYQRIAEQQPDASDLLESMYRKSGTTCYTPLLFNFSKSINGMLDAAYLAELFLEIDMNAFTDHTTNVGGNLEVEVELQSDYLQLPDKDQIAMHQSYPVTKSVTDVFKEKPVVIAAAGTHNVMLSNRGLCKRIYIALKNTTNTSLDYQQIDSVKLLIDGQVIHNSTDLENLYFNKSYLGVSSDAYPSIDSNLYVIAFDIASRGNGNYGAMSMNEVYADRKSSSVMLQVSTSYTGTIIVTEEMYAMQTYTAAGFIKQRRYAAKEPVQSKVPQRKVIKLQKRPKQAPKAPAVEKAPETKPDVKPAQNEIPDVVQPASDKAALDPKKRSREDVDPQATKIEKNPHSKPSAPGAASF